MAHDTNTKIIPFVIKGKYKLFQRKIRIIFFSPVEITEDNLDLANEKLMNFVSKKLIEDNV